MLFFGLLPNQTNDGKFFDLGIAKLKLTTRVKVGLS